MYETRGEEGAVEHLVVPSKAVDKRACTCVAFVYIVAAYRTVNYFNCYSI